MNKTAFFFNAVLSILFILTFPSCDSGGSSGGNSGLSCIEIEGLYYGTDSFANIKFIDSKINITSTCAFAYDSIYTGHSSGYITQKNGNIYTGIGVSPRGCQGGITVEIIKQGEGQIAFDAECR